MDALSDDDFANMASGSDEEDGDSDDLSVMSDFLNGDGKGQGQEDFDEDHFSDSDFDSELDEDDLDEDDLEEEAWGGIDGDASTSSSTNTVISNPEALEDQYGALQAKRARREAELESKKRKRLPTFGDKAALSDSDIDSSGSDSEDDAEKEDAKRAIANKKNKKNRVRHASVADSEESESEVARKNEYAKRSAAVVKPNPYGARFGRPSIASILSISETNERLQLAREEIASLGREITGEPELGMNLLKRLISFANKGFLGPDGETFSLDIPVRVWAMGSALAVFIDILPYVTPQSPLRIPCSPGVLAEATASEPLRTKRRTKRQPKPSSSSANTKILLSAPTNATSTCANFRSSLQPHRPLGQVPRTRKLRRYWKALL